MITGQLALISATAFASASTYINLVEQPARIDLDAQALLAEWRISYMRGTLLQVPLALIGASCGAVAFSQSHDWLWLCGATVLLSLLPWTVVRVMPINRRLISLSKTQHPDQIRGDVLAWGHAHWMRTVIGISATLFFTLASIRGGS